MQLVRLPIRLHLFHEPYQTIQLSNDPAIQLSSYPTIQHNNSSLLELSVRNKTSEIDLQVTFICYT